jgi:hypothetical protein
MTRIHITFGIFLALAATAAAQEKPLTTTKDNTDTVRIFVSGNINTDYIHRSHPITAFTDSLSNPTGAGAPLTSSAENTFEGEVGIQFNAELSNKVSAVVEFGTRRMDGDPAVGQGGINRFGDGEAIQIRLREVRILFPEVFLPELKAELGITTWSFNVRGKGGAFAFDPRRAQTVTRNLDSDGAPMNVRDDGFNRFAEAAFIEDGQPMGAAFSLDEGPVVVDLVLLPAVNEEGGAPRNDDQLYALDAFLNLDILGLGSRVAAIVAITTARVDAVGFTPGNKEARAKIYTVGGGGSIRPLKGLELYFEGYAQMGQGSQLFATRQRVAAGGHAVQLGAEWHYTVGNPLPFWFGLNFTHISGDSTDPADAGNRKASRFAAYEGVNDLMILEDPYYGFDWDSNYQAMKISGGASFTAARENDLDVLVILGITRAVNRVDVPTGGTENKLGDELDVRATWHMTKQFSLRLSLAYLWGSTLLEKSMGGNANPNARDHAWLSVLGWDLNF